MRSFVDTAIRNIERLRLGGHPEKQYTFIITIGGEHAEIQTAHDVMDALERLSRRLNITLAQLITATTSVYEDGQKILDPPGTLFSPVVTLPPGLAALFDLQDTLIENKFPHEKAQIIDTRLSNAGDIFREMAGGFYRNPNAHFTYVMEKWERLVATIALPPLSTLTEGDWDEIRENTQQPNYQVERDRYLANLHTLKDTTLRTEMEYKRRSLMLAALELIEALVLWFDSLDPYNPPRDVMQNLTSAIADYFPQFWEE